MDVKLRILRFNPETDRKSHWEEYNLEADPDERILDLLHKVKWFDDGSLAFRRSCAHGVCGSDAMVVNGENMLACQVLVKEVSNPIKIEPIRGLPVIKDLVVDMETFFESYKKVMPYLINEEEPGERERLQSPEDRDKLDGLYECILCACCSTSCPSFWWNPDKFVGPAALLQAYRFIADSRDTKTAERLQSLSDPFSVYRCHGIMNCVSVCPKGLNPNQAIGEIKSMLLSNKSNHNIITSDKTG